MRYRVVDLSDFIQVLPSYLLRLIKFGKNRHHNHQRLQHHNLNLICLIMSLIHIPQGD
jgi:hypothetical protein